MRLEDSLGYQINVAAKLLKRDLDNRLKKYQLTTTQWGVIKVLSENGKLTQVEIAEKMDSDQATCGAIIDRMYKRDLVQREAHETDRRAYVISLTEKSQNIISELEELVRDVNDHALNGINTKEKEFISEILRKIIINMKEG